ncbi:Chromosome partition protein Smc [bioreactor metagenome]|uniref:Chromosome partition protein Smc n=1 Tax=bioreactor metagenome TaxID=1076179 RepID=A0A644T0R0_9ZZZZ
MQLQRLGLYGFKSFAEKTDIEFGKGVTAIVGPNGSGKSNITDAIRWVLGEQSIRNLRGAKLEDVIFAGSLSRRQMGIAEVSLTFDNSDHLLPLDFNEVTITRRVFRSGDSEYYINKSACRLKDIHELLADTGLGRDSLTVISQNKIDEVLNSRPEERRLLFEEAAGIAKYKQRKKEAMRKLDDTAQNLTRVADITAELDNQLSPLAESAARTTRYNELYSELVICQSSLLLNRLTKAEKMVEIAKHEQLSLVDEEIKLSTIISIKESEEEGLRTDLTKADDALNRLMSDINKSNTEVERIDGQAAVLNERISQAEYSKTRINNEQASCNEQLKEISDKIAQASALSTEKQQLIIEVEKSLTAKTAEYDNLVGQIRSLEQKVEIGKDKTFDHLQELVTQRNAITSIDRELAKLKMLKIGYLAEQADFDSQLASVQVSLNEIIAEITSVAASINKNNLHHQDLETTKQVIAQDIDKLLLHDQKLTNLLNENKSRLKVLTHMQQEMEGFGRGIKSVLKSTAAWQSGVCGAVTQIIKVDQQFITAVEIALGGAQQHIITEDESIAKQAINYLKENRLGRATFLPLNTIKPPVRREHELAAANSQGALGFASELVECDVKYRRIIEYLLGRTIIAKNIDIAYDIAKRTSFSVKIVTLEGDLINPGGSMTGGTANRRDSSFLSRSKDIDLLQSQIGDIDQNLNQLKDEIAASQASLVDVTDKIQVVLEYHQQNEIRQAELTVHRDKLNADVKRLQLAQQTIAGEIQGCHADRTHLEQKLFDAKNAVMSLENLDLEHKQLIDEWRNKLIMLTSTKEELNIILTEKKVQLSALQQNTASLVENQNQLVDYAASLNVKKSNLLQELTKLENQLTATRAELDGIINARALLFEQRHTMDMEYKQGYSRKLDIVTSAQKLDKDLKESRRKHVELQNRLHEIELLDTKYGYEVTRCLDELRDQYSLTREAAFELYCNDDPSHLTKIAKRLEADIAELGLINPAAIDEYSKLQERRQFLQTQYDDLITAKDYLASIISDIDKTMGNQFSEAFNKINEYFGEIFVRMFGGGMAQIRLTDPDNLLNTGIEVIVQPPGKKLQNLVLLSGGERALTVIALLFSFLSYRPSPFVVVDEIDAPLDEENLRRFSSFLRDYAKNTQFIVVTHRKGTMEAADVMHGVTIEEAGISRLISVKFAERAG